ncbi:hypothetical protein [Mucilaginibacter sp. KACC 22063]|uniref:hypothetical protein n=1 Tax=Mucilaginibacter sp. KACC 22063 TaxID=3025666 RepID=UPI002366EBD7|nr:hypothetical protein [Mucilaginibacter sp. KACC 22063]WDF54354.1 hypothetical protein PQ461_15535 [Mucilaginibacter sp. KACC 22063]
MEERRTAAWVLGILAFTTIFFTVVLPQIRHSSTQALTFKSCTVRFKYDIKGLEGDITEPIRTTWRFVYVTFTKGNLIPQLQIKS